MTCENRGRYPRNTHRHGRSSRSNGHLPEVRLQEPARRVGLPEPVVPDRAGAERQGPSAPTSRTPSTTAVSPCPAGGRLVRGGTDVAGTAAGTAQAGASGVPDRPAQAGASGVPDRPAQAGASGVPGRPAPGPSVAGRTAPGGTSPGAAATTAGDR